MSVLGTVESTVFDVPLSVQICESCGLGLVEGVYPHPGLGCNGASKKIRDGKGNIIAKTCFTKGAVFLILAPLFLQDPGGPEIGTSAE